MADRRSRPHDRRRTAAARTTDRHARSEIKHGTEKGSKLPRDAAILEAAVKLFHRDGYDAVRLDDIGAQVGITGPAIYRHFRSKDELLAAAFDQAMDRLLLLTSETIAEPQAAVEGLISGQVQFVMENQSLLAVYAREDRALAEPYRRNFHRRQRAHVQRWMGALGRRYPGCSDAELEATAYAVIGLTLSVAHWPSEIFRAAGVADLLVDLARNSVRALAPTDASAEPVDPLASEGGQADAASADPG